MSVCGARAWSGLTAAALVAAGSGCLSAPKELDKEEARRDARWHVLVNAPRPGPELTLDWPGALRQMRRHNPKLQAADLDLARAEEALSQVRKSLIPSANFQAGYNRVFGNSAGVSFEPFTFAATFLFDVPGLLNFRTRYEAAVLNLTRARLARETLWRTQVIELYRAALERRDLDERETRLANGTDARRQLAASAPRAAAAERGRVRAEQALLSSRQAEWRQRAATLLALDGLPFQITESGLPPLPYETAEQRPSPETLARLPLRVAALELVALRARQLGVRLQQFPELDVSVVSPALYETGPGQRSIWSAREMVAGVDAFWTLDTQGRQKSESRLLAAEIAYRREVLDQEAIAVAGRLRSALEGLRDTDSRLATVVQAMGSVPTGLRQPLAEAAATLRSTRREWQCVLWFFDDAQWASLPA
jgi:hypothetical protein